MLIGELSRLSGFSKDTIRYYEKIALIELGRNDRRDNNYKDYPVDTLRTLTAIHNLKELGFTLEEIREIIIRKRVNALDGAASFRIIEQKLVHLDTQINKLVQYKQRLELARAHALGDAVSHIAPLTETLMRAA